MADHSPILLDDDCTVLVKSWFAFRVYCTPTRPAWFDAGLPVSLVLRLGYFLHWMHYPPDLDGIAREEHVDRMTLYDAACDVDRFFLWLCEHPQWMTGLSPDVVAGIRDCRLECMSNLAYEDTQAIGERVTIKA